MSETGHVAVAETGRHQMPMLEEPIQVPITLPAEPGPVTPASPEAPTLPEPAPDSPEIPESPGPQPASPEVPAGPEIDPARPTPEVQPGITPTPEITDIPPTTLPEIPQSPPSTPASPMGLVLVDATASELQFETIWPESRGDYLHRTGLSRGAMRDKQLAPQARKRSSEHLG